MKKVTVTYHPDVGVFEFMVIQPLGKVVLFRLNNADSIVFINEIKREVGKHMFNANQQTPAQRARAAFKILKGGKNDG